ncbi:hypothetical protein [Plebeiibacterium sediminum]|uniref:Uncharacterized protein n=1 Tax=Plebeiibacterium sediminum TaxID=2992112 RepID=A0AAE3M7K9_9BACT|nr:hypothetical protein [Plebeiobacterium sediminum]MCW3788482.1 hypothetical protein [Plebeiobacterium sediminum]
MPELQVSGGAQFKRAAIYETLDDGTERLVGVFDAKHEIFIKY